MKRSGGWDEGEVAYCLIRQMFKAKAIRIGHAARRDLGNEAKAIDVPVAELGAFLAEFALAKLQEAFPGFETWNSNRLRGHNVMPVLDEARKYEIAFRYLKYSIADNGLAISGETRRELEKAAKALEREYGNYALVMMREMVAAAAWDTFAFGERVTTAQVE